MLEINHLRRAHFPLEGKGAPEIGHPSVSLGSQSGRIGSGQTGAGPLSNSDTSGSKEKPVKAEELLIFKAPGPGFHL